MTATGSREMRAATREEALQGIPGLETGKPYTLVLSGGWVLRAELLDSRRNPLPDGTLRVRVPGGGARDAALAGGRVTLPGLARGFCTVDVDPARFVAVKVPTVEEASEAWIPVRVPPRPAEADLPPDALGLAPPPRVRAPRASGDAADGGRS